MIEKKFLSALQDVTNKVNTAADKTGKKVEEFVQDENFLRPVVRAAHSRLPFVVRMALKEETFVNFVMQHREKLLIQKTIEKNVSQIVKNLFDKENK